MRRVLALVLHLAAVLVVVGAIALIGDWALPITARQPQRPRALPRRRSRPHEAKSSFVGERPVLDGPSRLLPWHRSSGRWLSVRASCQCLEHDLERARIQAWRADTNGHTYQLSDFGLARPGLTPRVAGVQPNPLSGEAFSPEPISRHRARRTCAARRCLALRTCSAPTSSEGTF